MLKQPHCTPSVYFSEGVPEHFTIWTVDTIGSTNDWILENHRFLPEGAVLFARSQSAGRGRANRSFYSPADTGLYFSLLVKPHAANHHKLIWTQAAALAVCMTLEDMYGMKPQFQWPNDVYLHNKKVGGILCECIEEEGCVETMVIGIGLNLSTRFDEPLSQTAGSAFSDSLFSQEKEKIACEILRRFYQICEELSTDTVKHRL